MRRAFEVNNISFIQFSPSLILPEHHLLILLGIQVFAQRSLQCGPALLNGRENTLDLAEVVPHALHVAADLLRERQEFPLVM